jgi:hypothetical protein
MSQSRLNCLEGRSHLDAERSEAETSMNFRLPDSEPRGSVVASQGEWPRRTATMCNLPRVPAQRRPEHRQQTTKRKGRAEALPPWV